MAKSKGAEDGFIHIPADGMAEIRRIAGENSMTVDQVIRDFLMLGLIAADIKRTPGDSLVVERNGEMRELILFEPANTPKGKAAKLN